MFSGIIEAKGEILRVETHGRCKTVNISKPKDWKLVIGESINVDGICSTVVAEGARSFEVEYMPETLRKTTATYFQKGSEVNLERSLTYGDRIHGHFVQGHVDMRAKVVSIEKNGRSRIVMVTLPQAIARYVASRGSIAINGVSLTVAGTSRGSFTVALIPHTLEMTNLGRLKAGSEVNLEVDMLARYGLASIKEGGRVGRNAAKKARTNNR